MSAISALLVIYAGLSVPAVLRALRLSAAWLAPTTNLVSIGISLVFPPKKGLAKDFLQSMTSPTIWCIYTVVLAQAGATGSRLNPYFFTAVSSHSR
jgi:hypothetical protein